NNGKERYGRRHSQDNRICNPGLSGGDRSRVARYEPNGDQPNRKHDSDQHAGTSPHALSLALTEGGQALRLHNFRPASLSYGRHNRRHQPRLNGRKGSGPGSNNTYQMAASQITTALTTTIQTKTRSRILMLTHQRPSLSQCGAF